MDWKLPAPSFVAIFSASAPSCWPVFAGEAITQVVSARTLQRIAGVLSLAAFSPPGQPAAS